MVATTAAQTGGPVAVWDDGKITLGGGLAVNNAAAFALFRLDQHGNFDQSFGSNAAVYQQFNGYSTLNALVPTPDGSMLAAGSTVTDQGNFQWYVARYDPSGDLDDSFGTSGSPRSSRPPRVRSGGWGSRVTAPSSWPVTCNNRGSSGT
jgi:hypothetical protein